MVDAGQTEVIRDPGLQAERTALAWNRTAAALLVNAMLALRSGWAYNHAMITALAMVLLSATGAAFLFGAWRRRHLLDAASGIPARAVALAAIFGLAASLTALVNITLTEAQR